MTRSPTARRSSVVFTDCRACGMLLPLRPAVVVASELDEAPDLGAPIVVRSGPGCTQADAARSYAAHAVTMAGLGVQAVLTELGRGSSGIGRLVMIGMWASQMRPDGFTVTDERHVVEAAPALNAVPAPADEASPRSIYPGASRGP